MKIVTTSILLTLAATAGAFAQSASDTASAYFNALQEGDYAKATGFFSDEAMENFRGMMDFSALPPQQAPMILGTFFGQGATAESVAAMTDDEFFTAFMPFLMNQAKQAGGLDFNDVDVLGEVPEGEDVVHVLTRITVAAGGVEMQQMEVVSFEETDSGYEAMLSGQMKGMAAQLQRAFQRQ